MNQSNKVSCVSRMDASIKHHPYVLNILNRQRDLAAKQHHNVNTFTDKVSSYIFMIMGTELLYDYQLPIASPCKKPAPLTHSTLRVIEHLFFTLPIKTILQKTCSLN